MRKRDKKRAIYNKARAKVVTHRVIEHADLSGGDNALAAAWAEVHQPADISDLTFRKAFPEMTEEPWGWHAPW